MKTLKIIIILLIPLNAWSALVTTSLKLDVVRPFEGEPKTLKGYKKHFFEKIKNIENKKFKICSKKTTLPKGTPERMQAWWSYMSLNCLDQMPAKNKSYKELSDKISGHIDSLSKYKGDKSYLSSHLGSILVKLASQKRYKVSDKEKQFLINSEDYLGEQDRAKFYNFMASRLKSGNKNREAAQFYFKAYNLNEEKVYATKLKTLINENPSLLPQYKIFSENYTSEVVTVEKTTKFNSYYRRGQHLNVIREGVKLLNKKNSTEKAIIKKMYRVIRKRVKKASLTTKLAKESLKCHSECIYKFSKNYYLRHKYKLAMAYAEAANKKASNARAQLILGMSNIHLGNYPEAKEWLAMSYKNSSLPSREYFESLFRLGLLHYRLKNYSKVRELFSGMKVHKEQNDFNLQTMYWFWRALQKLEDRKQIEIRDLIIKQYPLTYYGLMANQDKNKGKLILPTNYQIVQKEMPWSPEQKISWSNFKDFVEMQFFYLAKKELKILFSTDKDDVETVLYAYYSSIAADHYTAIKSMNIIWDRDPYAHFTKTTARLTVPIEYDSFVQEFSKKNDLEVNLVRSLIKQESSFILKARSGSNAMGLMQIIPITAKDAAKYIGLKINNLKTRVYEPKLNVKLGASYLRRLVRAFKGHVPLSLAAYNAGIGNIRRWTKYRPEDLVALQDKNSSKSEDEIWIDELPWAETSFYVKAIMRNLILYRFYYNDIKKIPEPSWAAAEAP